ncbi:amidase, partial [Thioclava sp. BHET1]
ERIMGIRYTTTERQQMQDNLDDQIDRATRRRALVFENDAPMALRFDPRLPGFAMPGGVDRQNWTAIAAPLPEAEEDIAFAPLPHLAHWLQSGQISSQRLCRIYLDRIARFAPDLFCFAHVCADRAMAEAAAVDAQLAAGIRLGPLQGVPYGLKDLFDVAGLPTGWGAEPWRDRIAEADAAVVTRLRAAGAVLLGKTAVGALAYGDIWYEGRCRNPWNLNEGSSGSSAGSASAVAAGLCAFAIGTETLGSITSPSQRCGTTGLRPTFGRVSRAGGMVLCPTLDKVGPICRGVEDTAMVLAAINGGDATDPGSIAAPFRFEAGQGIAGLRVGYLAGSFGAGATEVDRAMLDALHDLGITPIPLDLPDLPYDALPDILMAEAAATFEAMTLSDQDDLLRWQEAAAWPN